MKRRFFYCFRRTLRQAFAQVMKDDSFKVDIQKAQLDFDPLTGEELQRIVADLLGSPRSLSRWLAKHSNSIVIEDLILIVRRGRSVRAQKLDA